MKSFLFESVTLTNVPHGINSMVYDS